MRRDRSAVLHFVSQLVRSLAGFGSTLFAAKYFGAGGLGIYSQIIALLFWLKLPGNSIRTAVSKRMSESRLVTGHFAAGLFLVLVYGVVVSLFIIALDGFVASYVGTDVAVLLVGLVLANMLLDITRAGLEGRRQVALSGWLSSIESLLRLVGQVTFALTGALVLGLVYGHIVSMAVIALTGLFLLWDHLTLPSRADFTDLRRFTQYSWLSNVEGIAINWLDLLVLGFFVADKFVGIYTAAWTLTGFLSLAGKSISSTLFPELSELGSDERLAEARQLVSDSLLFTGIFLIPGLFGALAIGDRILRIYGPEFAQGAYILVILLAARTVHTFGRQAINTLNGLDYPRATFRVNTAFILLNLVLNVGLVSLFSLYGLGWYGAAVATLLSSCGYLWYGWQMLTDRAGSIPVPAGDIAKQGLASVVMGAAVYSLTPFVPASLPYTLTLVALGAAIYGAVLVVISAEVRLKLCRLVTF
ncbi:polysaccharide biosynthesis C-terminal domain-containing protein [Haloarcula laminariae]|uniref:oligosaccharide flippase family protein n=1 Tax=Haloarcula laminariae TaxID=2961577 RepID=UPI0021C95297|nr:polysaccharide biosynthesis C-terminal domain-containing protein [Halomicroarcula laminariae]